jgi:hypothetical protein
MLQFLKDLVSGIAAWLRLQDRRQAAMDSPAMQANERAKHDAAIRDTAVKAVKNDDLDAIRRQAAE